MVYYVTANDPKTEKRACRKLQLESLSDCFFSPCTAFTYLAAKDVSDDEEMALRLDILSFCDVLVVVTEIDEQMRQEIEFANLIGTEVRYLEV